jgi:hypothetical protein
MKRIPVLCLIFLAVTIGGMAGEARKGGKDVGIPSGAVAVMQKTTAGTVIFSEGFNGATFPPAGWTMRNMDGNVAPESDPSDTAWYQSANANTSGSPLAAYEGDYFAAAYYGTANASNVIDDWLITPNTGGSAPGGSTDSLVFWLASRLSDSGNFPDSLDIRVSTAGANPADFTTRLAYVLAPKAKWTRYAYKLPIAANRYIAFRYLVYDGGAAGSNSDKVDVDDVRIIRYGATAVEGAPRALPTVLALQQNYPNPFNPVTEIQYGVPNAGFVSLRVFDQLGREVASLVNDRQDAGVHTVRFDGAGLTSGVYFYRLTAGSSVVTRAMVLSK